MQGFHEVVVIGAGCAGLYAASLLASSVSDVLVVEAQDRPGGRVKELHGMAPWPVQLGPEFIHGAKSLLVDVLRGMGVQFVEKPWPDHWYFEREKRLVADDDVDDEVHQVHELMAAVADTEAPPAGTDISCEAWLQQRGASVRQLAIADACYANDFGCSLRQLGLREARTEAQAWDSGDTYLLPDRPLTDLPKHLAQGLKIHYSWPVSCVEYGPGGVCVTGPGGAQLRCRALVCTVPLPLLQRGNLHFRPPLPMRKRAALARVRSGNAVKVVCAFSYAFWPEKVYDVVCPDSLVPEFWMTSYPTQANGVSPLRAVVGFIAGERAEVAAAASPQVLADAFVAQLDRCFGTPSAPRPATKALVRSTVVNWATEPFARGAYTYPSLGAEQGDREALAAPVQGCIFFAGEATHEGINPCLQAALETGQRAALQVAATLAPQQSKL